MFDFSIGQVFGLLLRTLPFLLLRVAVYVGIAIAYIVAVGAGSAIGYLMGTVGGNSAGGTGWGGMIGFGIVTGLLYWAREYLLYLVKAGHIAVLVELMDGRSVPAGQGQIEFGRNAVRQQFGTSSMLFGLHQLVRGILRAFHRATVSIASWLPIPGLDAVVKLADAIINTSISHLDQVILAQILRAQATRADAANPWATARDSVVLYAQNYKGVLRNAIFLTPVIWVLTALIFVVVFAPFAAMVGVFHLHVGGFWMFALALVMALCLKAALIDPFAMVALMQVYDRITAGQTPDPDWIAKLDAMSSHFRNLSEQAGRPMGSPIAAR